VHRVFTSALVPSDPVHRSDDMTDWGQSEVKYPGDVGRSPLLRSYIRLDRTRFVTSRTIRLTPDSDIDRPITYRPFALDIDPRPRSLVVLDRPLSYVLAPPFTSAYFLPFSALLTVRLRSLHRLSCVMSP
jgi:hypothetical protein